MLDTTSEFTASINWILSRDGHGNRRPIPTEGVTSSQFREMCNRHLPKYGTKQMPQESIDVFLDRCCDLGYLRVEVHDTRRYLPTEKLVTYFARLEVGV